MRFLASLEMMKEGGTLRFVRALAHEFLPALLVLYPLLLLLDDLEPGFVRSVVNPHWFLLALIVIGIVAGRETASPSPAFAEAASFAGVATEAESAGRRSPSRGEGEKLKVVFAFAAAIVAGFWVWWRVGGGRIGVIIGLLAAVAIGMIASTMNEKGSGPFSDGA